VTYLLHHVLPNFKTQKKYATTASLLLKTDIELKQQKNSAFSKFLAAKVVPTIENKVKFDYILGHNFRKMYQLLGKEETFEEMVANKITISLVGTLPFLALPIITSENLYFLALPIGFILFFFILMQAIRVEYKKRQSEIIRDLPQLIDKMLIALESGKPFITTFQQVQKSSGPRMANMIKKLIADMQIMKATDALEIFAKDTGIPVMYQFAVACKIGIENGYEESQNYFYMIKDEMKELRKASLEELTRSKPEKVKLLYVLLVGHAFVAILIAFFEIFKQANEL
jgi:hypothetical protein